MAIHTAMPHQDPARTPPYFDRAAIAALIISALLASSAVSAALAYAAVAGGGGGGRGTAPEAALETGGKSRSSEVLS